MECKSIMWSMSLILVVLIQVIEGLRPFYMQEKPPSPISRLWSTLFQAKNVDKPMSRIHRGWFLDPHEFPWMVKIKALFPRDGPQGRLQSRTCGGALISPEWVISARHCVTWNPPGRRGYFAHQGPNAVEAKVFLGGHGNFGEDGLMVPVALAVGRDDYGHAQCNSRESCNAFVNMFSGIDTIFTNDIVLLMLEYPVHFTQKIQPIRLPVQNKDYIGERAFVSGWGIQHRRDGPPGFLKAAELEIIPSDVTSSCWDQKSWGKMCAVASEYSHRSGSVCPGDSGSPLVVMDPENGGWTLVGLLSNGAKSCFDEMPAVYTRVGDYLQWIFETVNYPVPRI